MKVSPLKMKYSGKGAPAGVPALRKGGTETSPKRSTSTGGVRKTVEAPMGKRHGRLVTKGDDKSSGQSNPIKRGDDNKKRYTPIAQPSQYSNDGPRPTKFIC